jgi:dolichyl-phosphate beta-glucosyltransferase
LGKPFLSIIIPAYNEEKRLPRTLEQVVSFLQSQDYPVEVLVVENGSVDRTFATAKSFSDAYPHVGCSG